MTIFPPPAPLKMHYFFNSLFSQIILNNGHCFPFFFWFQVTYSQISHKASNRSFQHFNPRYMFDKHALWTIEIFRQDD